MMMHRQAQKVTTAHRRHPRHRFPRPALLVAGLFAVAALVWMLIGVPALVKYPTDLDASPRYEGTFTVLVDPSTAAPLAEPMVLPLTVDRHIQAIGEESGSSRVVVRETITQRAGELLDVTQTNTYVMDRSTLKNVADDRAFAFDPANVVDRSGAYRLNLPFDTSRDGTYEMYKNEIGDTYQLVANTESPTTDIEGLHLSNFTASLQEAPLTAAYLAELNKAVPLPTSLTLEQMKPQLLAAGIDVDAVLAALTPVLTPEDTATLGQFAAEPIQLDYVLSFDGQAAVEPVTGAEVKVSADESVGVVPQLTSLPVLQDVLSHYPDLPVAAATSDALEALATGPAIPLFQYGYDQTPASVADIADEAGSMRDQVLLAKVWLPLALAAIAVLSLIVGAIVFLRRRPRHIDLTSLSGPLPEPRPATAEQDRLTTSGRGSR